MRVPVNGSSAVAASSYERLLGDLAAEHASLSGLVDPLEPRAWDAATPASGWTVRDQVFHLLHYDEVAATAIVDAEAFRTLRAAALADPAAYEDAHRARAAALPVDELRQAWHDAHHALVQRLASLDGDARIEWFGPPMSARTFATARLMEIWAHGDDVAVAVGRRRRPTSRLRHVAHLGVLTRSWSYRVRGEEPPAGDVLVELEAPDGTTWSWGPSGAADRIAGPAEDFALLVTQRVHLDETRLVVEGDLARSWAQRAQAFAGGPGAGRTAGSRSLSLPRAT